MALPAAGNECAYGVLSIPGSGGRLRSISFAPAAFVCRTRRSVVFLGMRLPRMELLSVAALVSGCEASGDSGAAGCVVHAASRQARDAPSAAAGRLDP